MARDVIIELFSKTPALAVLATFALVLLIGTSCQILAERLRIPATGPLLLAGLICGPGIIGIIQPDLLGVGLRVVVRAAVCICIFEGALMLDLSLFRQASRAVLGLVTVGLLITTALAAGVAHALLNWSWQLSLLFGAIVSVTGPTVITPILHRVRVNDRVRTTLESESVIADPLGVILASLIFTAITSPGGWQHAFPYAGSALLTAIFVGASTATVIWIVSKHLSILPPKYARLVILGSAIVSYTVAEILYHESGVLAAAVAGIAIGSMKLPYRQQIEEFKGDIASIAISAVFILLAASLRPRELADLGWREILVVLLLMLAVRPICVFISTFGSELRTNEKWFISLLGPRGIVAASVATFFSLELIDSGFATSGRELVTLVFAVVLGTVLIEGTAAGWTARYFNVMPKHTIIVGADAVTSALALRLTAAGESVTIIDSDPSSCERLSEHRDLRVICDDATDVPTLRRAGAPNAKTLIAATSSDKLNLLISHVARSAFTIPRLIARANSSTNVSAFRSAGIEVMSVEDATAAMMENLVLRPSFYDLVSGTSGDEILVDVEVSSRAVIGKSLSDVALPYCIVVALRRDGEILIPKGKTTLRAGDVLTIMGSQTAADAAKLRFGGGAES